MTANPFKKATKTQLKARVALAGPTGSGKTYTALEWATVLADGRPIAVVDTEHGSASLYSDRFEFDVLDWPPPYDPTALSATIRQAVDAGYAVVVIDSLSHFWEGEGGTLDIADAAGQRSGGNSFAGWKVATPALRHLVDTMLAADTHVLATMRSKMEWVLEEDSRGKKVPRKIGMAPVMRQGIEYEFTLVGDMDLEHRMMVSKSRCSSLADAVVQPGRGAEAAEEFLTWLTSGAPDPVAVRRQRFLTLPADAQEKILGWLEKGTGATAVDQAPREVWSKLDEVIDRAAFTAAGEAASVGAATGEQRHGMDVPADGTVVELEASGPDAPGVAPDGGVEPAVGAEVPVVVDDRASVDQSTPRATGGDADIPDNPEFDIEPEPFEPMTELQSRKLHALLRDVHQAAGPARFPVLSGLLGRDVGSTKEIDRHEASRLIDDLQTEADKAVAS
jgi:hypothetical protein